MLNLSAITLTRQWRIPALVACAGALFAGALLSSSAVSRELNGLTRASTSATTAGEVVSGGVSATDRQIGVLQDRLRQQPADQPSATQLGLAYLQRARETSDPSFLTR